MTDKSQQRSGAENRQMRLAVFAQGAGVAQGAWRSPRNTGSSVNSLEHWVQVARVAEEGKLDAVFIADALALSDSIGSDATDRPDPVVVLSALAAATSSIGLVGTSSTTYNDPFTVARQFATLDQMSNGRAGWNIVTTAQTAAAENYNDLELPPHEERYERAEEFVDVVLKLWGSWEPDALVADRDSGVYADLAKVHRIGHRGKHFQVAGPLTTPPRSPQGHPVLVQAGSSPTGMRFAARFAEMAFTTQPDLDESQAFASALKDLAKRAGRDPDEIKVMPGLTPIVGRTEAEARELANELGQLISERAATRMMEQSFGGLDLTAYDLDEPFPEVRGDLPANSSISRAHLFTEMALREGLTLRQLIQRIGLSLGHRLLVGTADQVADDMARWFECGAADGFNILPADLPAGLSDFVELVVPRLQDRGLFRREYTASTLRGHLRS